MLTIVETAIFTAIWPNYWTPEELLGSRAIPKRAT